MKRKLHIWFVSLLLSTSLSANAAPILDVQGGLLVGASGVDVNGTLYDVSFVDGSCVGLYGGCDELSDFAFQNVADATDASEALLDQVLLDGLGLANWFDTFPELTNGCPGGGFTCNLFTPYALNGGLVEGVFAVNDTLFVIDGTDLATLGLTEDTSMLDMAVYAVWSVQDQPVSEPGALLLLLAGLAAMGAAKRLNRR